MSLIYLRFNQKETLFSRSVFAALISFVCKCGILSFLKWRKGLTLNYRRKLN